jgi:hypothetical protein
MVHRSIFVTLVLVIIISGCDRIFSSEPKPDDLVGSYVLSSNSEAFLRKRKEYVSIPSSVIELGTNYSVSIKNLPDCATNGFGRSHGKFLTGKGTWEIEKDSIGYGISFVIHEGGSLGRGIYAGPWIAIRRRSAPYILEVTIGDPDSRETIRYERKSS